MATSQVANHTVNCHQAEIVRPVANFSPSLWGDRFSSLAFDNKVFEDYAKEIEVLKEEAKKMLKAPSNNWVEKLNLIDTVERLGVSYHFEEEIETQLVQILEAHPNFEGNEDCDLHTVALYFRIFRQHGYDMPCGAFNNFKGSNGKFKESLSSDIRGLLSLYEAAHTRIHGEDILEEALAFATINLEFMKKTHVSPTLAKQVAHALEQSLHRGIPRVEIKSFILFYEQDESRCELLLRFAKLDFNLLQMLHKQELYEVSRWWKELDLISKLSYARDRAVECYFWTVGVYFEPKYSRARIMLAKTIAMISILDDTYDAYGTVDELQLYTDAIQRWDTSEINSLPDYMKISYKALLNLYDGYEAEVSKDGRSSAAYHAKERMKEIVRCYFIEAKWFIEGYIPPFDEYLRNALPTCTYYLLTTTSYLGMKETATREVFEWLQTNPKMLEAEVLICRVIDDVATYKVEKDRGQVATGIECYMRQYGVSKEEAMNEFQKMSENAWKDINEEWIKIKTISKEILLPILNLTRIIDVTYKNNEDGYTHPEKVLKKHIMALLVDSLVI